MVGTKTMTVKTQTAPTEWQRLAAVKCPGYGIEGDGPYAVVDNSCCVVMLFGEYQLARIARAEAHWRRDIYLLKPNDAPVIWERDDWEPK
jgi:hypothetical protein